MRAAVLLATLSAVAAAGCLQCQDQLDVHQCRGETGRCDTAGEVVAQWDPELSALWPDLGRLIGSTGRGEHGHADWTPEQAAAFWAFWHVPADRPDKQVFLRHEGGLYHVRVLAC